jgi:hypothetical protein
VLIGVDLELQRRMAEGIGQKNGAPEQAAPNLAAPNLAAPENAALVASAPVSAEPQFSAPEQNAPSTDAPKEDAPEFDVHDLLTRRAGARSYLIHSISRIEDILTPAERELLRWLWERGRPAPMTQRLRLASGPDGEGARRLAVQAGLIYNTFKNLSRALARKFALDIVKPERNLPAIYVVYDDSSILERQRGAGFTGAVHKNGGGRELVDSQGQAAPRRQDLTVVELQQILSALKFGALKESAPNFSA